MILRRLLPLLCLLALPACANPSDTQSPAALTLVSWNIEHLAERDGAGCRPRSAADYQALQTFAASLKADVVALQEVESEAALARVFPKSDWQLVVSPRAASETYDCRGSKQRSTQQRVALAIRKGVSFSYDPAHNLSALGLNEDGLRHGLVVSLTATQPATELLVIHAKSGCFIDDYRQDTERRACQLLAQQAPILDGWIEQRLAANTPFAVLGDFNNRLLKPGNHLWQELLEMNGKPAALINAMQGLNSCHPKYPDLIDHILLGGPAAAGFERFSARSHRYPGDTMLADHCPISAKLARKLPQAGAVGQVSSAVTWTRNAVEYRMMTQALYAQTQAHVLSTPRQHKDPWVVFMDVDETLLDNSAYNLARDQQGLGFSSDSWAAWVAAEQAGEVPGAKAFVNAVLAAGGQLALITNRNRDQDHHTWANLRALGFAIDKRNTCILGRAPEDKAAVGQAGIINDKDLRRQQVLAGTATDCWKTASEAKPHWARKLSLVLEVGDNIQDFSQQLQDRADAAALAPRQGRDLLLLPNAMYGSWSH
ncbi:HAD family acid phosphatase [Simiduia aestuariiviva]|uniref:Putative secreted acid phosphatase/endonuclease/exonuclease/phosphatase family metal-dependent hydrolase n=1 Tax=Simiduia aestuariiviva TaxID=1510459 RepID=A0A839UVL7_9GAMM|nr:HAD family acid phosphatase [Simiduia aestuariiviva]MBB3169508.1 putative secreted acid phosphatase/endonuclease/exonuclease/phosphatase family metal-dependent hydrolase [Simiduia aestuariiviva]